MATVLEKPKPSQTRDGLTEMLDGGHVGCEGLVDVCFRECFAGMVHVSLLMPNW